MARYSLVVLKVPLNTNGPANQYFELGHFTIFYRCPHRFMSPQRLDTI